ncbi:SGNH/GDSL hydrolase family protein [Metabacillus sp. 84]|uniref:SGNH/GDSL hydrolase family protein n=1 Tax=unclassified Metabacillus TaxID=2675274 RepID=UPI003CF6B144
MKMKKYLILFAACLVPLAGCNQFSFQTEEPAAKKATVKRAEKPLKEVQQGDITITGVGDSLTAGIGDDTRNGGYVGVVKNKLMNLRSTKNVAVNNYAVHGNLTTDLLIKLDSPEVQESIKKSDIILLTIGGNDIMKVLKENIFDLTLEPFKEEQSAYEERMSEILETIRTLNPDAKIIYSGLYNPFKFALPELSEIDLVVADWNKAARSLLEEDENAVYVPVSDIYQRENENLLYDDAFHPNKEGYSLIGERVFDAIVERDNPA